MAQLSELSRLKTAWRALSDENKGEEGWRTIPIRQSGRHRLLAGRFFPGNSEAILVGFHSVKVPSQKNLPEGRGFHIEQVKLEFLSFPGIWVALSRQAVGSLDMFARMAEDVASMLENYEHVDDQTLFQLFLNRIRAWQEFMLQARTEVLGFEMEIGLVGELCFLNLLLQNGVPVARVIDAWQGPLDGLHDFLLGYGAIEVKSTTATNSFPATVSSLTQLDASLVSCLFLTGVRFNLDADGKTLPEFVQDIIQELRDMPEEKGRFESLVLRAGYLRTFSDSYERRFSHSDTRIFLVDKEFPALTRDKISPAIRKARYEMDLDLVSAPSMGIDRALEILGVK